jgi:hypothetical protein
MNANPGEDTLVLTSESDLERAAMRRWAGRQAVLEEWTDDNGRGTVVLAFRGPAKACVNVDTAPGRTVRLPAIGQRVAVAMRPYAAKMWELSGRVDRIEIAAGGVSLGVRGDGDTFSTPAPPEDVRPVGDDPPWVEVELPE